MSLLVEDGKPAKLTAFCGQQERDAGVEGASMLVRDLERQECLKFLKLTGFGRLGCANDNQPYVVPIYFAYESEQLFGFSTEGQKIGWMRANPLVCVLADDIKSEHEWTSVLVMGRYEELPDNPQYEALRRHAHELLEKKSLWWGLAIASSQTRDEHLPVLPVLYRIQIEEMSGHRSSADQESQDDAFAESHQPTGAATNSVTPVGEKQATIGTLTN